MWAVLPIGAPVLRRAAKKDAVLGRFFAEIGRK
jgi:hypothetical protein